MPIPLALDLNFTSNPEYKSKGIPFYGIFLYSAKMENDQTLIVKLKAETLEADGNEGDLTASIQRFVNPGQVRSCAVLIILDTFTHRRSQT